MFILHKTVSSVICLSNEVVWIFQKAFFFTNCDEMLDFVNSKNGVFVLFSAIWRDCWEFRESVRLPRGLTHLLFGDVNRTERLLRG